jgi:hypothetical protein
MTKPKKEIRVYLRKLVDHFFYINNLNDQLRILKSWESPKRVAAIEVGTHFFGLVSYSFQRAILIELCKLLSEDEDKSLVDFLRKAKEHANSIDPQIYDIASERHRTVATSQYRSVIQQHKKMLDDKKGLIKRIRGRRNKMLAHSDATYFNNPEKIYSKYPINIIEIDELLETVSTILKSHYNYLFNTDLGMTFHTSTGLEAVLIYVRAYKRFWEDNRLTKLKKFSYSQDNFDVSDSIYL